MRDYKKQQLSKELETILDYLLKDYREVLVGEEGRYMVTRITDFLDAKKQVKMDDFTKVCRHMVENALTYRKITVATIKTAWCKVHEQE